MRLATYKKGRYKTESSVSEFNFCSTDGASGKWILHNKEISIFPCIGVPEIGLWFSSMNFFTAASSILVSGPHMHIHNVYCKFSYYLPLTEPDLRRICICSYTEQIQRSWCLPHMNLGTETNPHS
jgi:hypothetical protein